jgi:hypothetical protein
VLAAVAAVSTAVKGLIVAELAAKVHAMTDHTEPGYSICQTAYDLRKRRAKDLTVKPGAVKTKPNGLTLPLATPSLLTKRTQHHPRPLAAGHQITSM